jgi:hypothetical protein
MKKLSPPFIALLEALGLTAYIALFAAVVIMGPRPEDMFARNPIFGMGTFLLAFVTSALICGSIVLGYPSYLFFNGEREKALKIVAWSVAWLVVLLVIAVAIGLYAA